MIYKKIMMTASVFIFAFAVKSAAGGPVPVGEIAKLGENAVKLIKGGDRAVTAAKEAGWITEIAEKTEGLGNSAKVSSNLSGAMNNIVAKTGSQSRTGIDRTSGGPALEAKISKAVKEAKAPPNGGGKPLPSSRIAVSYEDTDGPMVKRLKDINGNQVGYFKYAVPDEVRRIDWLNELFKEHNIAAKYDRLEIELPKILSRGYGMMTPELAERIKDVIKEGGFKAEFADSPVVYKTQDISGLTVYDMAQMGRNGWPTEIKAKSFAENLQAGENRAEIIAKQQRILKDVFLNIPVSREEFTQAKDLIRYLNELGFYHSDVASNIFFRRVMVNGKSKLKITFISDLELNRDVLTGNPWNTDRELFGLAEEYLSAFHFTDYNMFPVFDLYGGYEKLRYKVFVWDWDVPGRKAIQRIVRNGISEDEYRGIDIINNRIQHWEWLRDRGGLSGYN